MARNNSGDRRGDGKPSDLVRLLVGLNRCYARVFHRLTVHSPCRLPRRGPAILVCNHTSALDPLLIQSACPRMIRWMMAREYCTEPVRWFFDAVEIIPVERSGRDMAATRAAIRALQSGYVLGVFPEGRIETSREFLPFQSGIGLLALKSGAPVYPAYLDGTQRGAEMIQAFVKSNTCSLTFGKAIRFPAGGSPRHQIETATQCIQRAIADLAQNGPATRRQSLSLDS